MNFSHRCKAFDASGRHHPLSDEAWCEEVLSLVWCPEFAANQRHCLRPNSSPGEKRRAIFLSLHFPYERRDFIKLKSPAGITWGISEHKAGLACLCDVCAADVLLWQ